MSNNSPLTPPLWSWRRATIAISILILGICLYHLGFKFNQLPPGADPLSTAKKFFSAALTPAFSHQNPSLPADATPFLQSIGINMLNTIRYAFIAMSVALPAGLTLGFLASKTWWPKSRTNSLLYLIYIPTRFITTFIRSIHELIWVMLFLAFLGDSPLTACLALSLPFAGTLAKVFSEILDEQPPAASDHIRLAGGNGIQAFIAARLPQALPDLLTYTLYRLECAIRSSAVLGFVGVQTIGLSIHQSYANNYYNEVWTELYLLVLVVIFFDFLGSTIRKRLHAAPLAHTSPDPKNITQLRKQAPRWKLLKISWLTLTATSIAAWFIGHPLNQYHSHITRWERTKTFFESLIPTPVRESGSWTDTLPWAQNLWQTNGANALFETIIMATTALLLAALFGYTLVPWASRNIANYRPFGIASGKPNKLLKTLWATLGLITRFLFLLSRSIPEFIIAFLLIGILGPHAWPLIIALAIHNFGILGRLWSEITENNQDAIAKAQTLTGATRLKTYLTAIIPTAFNRQILFIFYRWETCIRESTVLGILSVTSLGYYIKTESAFLRYDSMLFYILLGTAIIFLSDLASIALRAKLRKS